MTDAERVIEIGGQLIEIWPRRQMLHSLGHPRLIKTSFADAGSYHAGLRNRILQLVADQESPKGIIKFTCGRKVHDLETWDCPEANLIDARARALFRQVMKSPTASVDNSWATFYQSGDFCLPHSHLRAEASVVYLLDPGNRNPRWKGNGRLGFADPRLEICCQDEPGRMTTPQFPQLSPGDMLIFPGELIHLVCPYEGERPRITLSWNINRQPIPGAHAHHAEFRRRAAQAGRPE